MEAKKILTPAGLSGLVWTVRVPRILAAVGNVDISHNCSDLEEDLL